MRLALPALRSRRARAASSAAASAAIVVSAAALVALPTHAALAAGSGCQATYTVTSDWGRGFQMPGVFASCFPGAHLTSLPSAPSGCEPFMM